MKQLGQSGNDSQLWIPLVMKIKSNAVKECYCIGTWTVRPMNQGKLGMVKQEMVRMNIDILGISELKWTGTGESNSDDLLLYLSLRTRIP